MNTDFTLEEMVEEAERISDSLPDPPGGAFSIHPREHRHLVAEARHDINDASEVEYCDECWHVVDGDACPECGSTERFDFGRGDE